MEPRIKRVKHGGLFTGGEVEYQDITYQVLDAQKMIIVCNNCQGGGEEPYYGGRQECRFCKGTGTLKLKNPKNVL